VTTGESLLGSSLNVDETPRRYAEGRKASRDPRLRTDSDPSGFTPAGSALERDPTASPRGLQREKRRDFDSTRPTRRGEGRQRFHLVFSKTSSKLAETERESPGQAIRRAPAPADATGKTSKGNKAHGRSGSRDSGNGARETPDPQVEQRLEADAKARSGDELRIRQRTAGRNRTRSEGTARRQRSRQRDTATGGETSSRGVKRAAGNACSRVPDDSFASHEGRMQAGNAVNPRIGSGMQQARDSEGGENRRGGAKPRGRNGIRGWLPRTEARPAMVEREWTPAEHVDGGAGFAAMRPGKP